MMLFQKNEKLKWEPPPNPKGGTAGVEVASSGVAARGGATQGRNGKLYPERRFVLLIKIFS